MRRRDHDRRTRAGTFVRLWTSDGGSWSIAVEEEPRIDAAVSRWVDSGETRDTLLLVTLTGGDPLKLRASFVASWMISTPEGRRRELEISKESDDEQERVRKELGIWEDE